MDFIFENPWIFAFYGWLLFNYLLFVLDKDKKDDKGRKFMYLAYAKKQWDNWSLSLLFVPLLVYYGPVMLQAFNDWLDKGFTWYSIYYGFAGIITEAAYRWVKKYKK